ncbi:MAG: hypothetical protein JRJ19_04295 [Deltaproteobacteria bacterium]|nr:hypothetical protein [Deltaproteobacteria bacterium]MBW1871260.1 hypothetical protein [Deltaproteobacteria bacterium]
MTLSNKSIRTAAAFAGFLFFVLIFAAGQAHSGEKAERLRTYDDCHKAAKVADKDRKKGKKPSKRLYKAVFDGKHFEIDEYDRMESHTPIRPEIWFLGAFPPCVARPNRFLSAFNVAEGEVLALPMDEITYTKLLKLKKSGKLKLHLEFRPVDVKMHPMPPYDAKACPGNQPEFTHDDIAPQVFIRAVKGWVQSASGKKYSLIRIDDEGKTQLTP